MRNSLWKQYVKTYDILYMAALLFKVFAFDVDKLLFRRKEVFKTVFHHKVATWKASVLLVEDPLKYPNDGLFFSFWYIRINASFVTSNNVVDKM